MRVSTLDDPTGDSTSASTVWARQWLNIAWQFPANCPNPESFEILIFAAGTDCNNSNNWLLDPIPIADGSVRAYSFAIFPKTATANLDVAVRAIYA